MLKQGLHTASVPILLGLMLLSLSALTPTNASAAQLLVEDFEGTFPPTGWTVTNDSAGSPVVWHRNDQTPNYAANQGAPISGFHAYVESYPAYCGDAYDTSLVTPAFSTVGADSVMVRFDYQYWVYSNESLDLDYRIGAGPWINVQHLPNTGGYTAQSLTLNISVTKDNPDVQLRWRYVSDGARCDWWANLDNVSVVLGVQQASAPAMSGWALILLASLLVLTGVRRIRRCSPR